MHLVPRPLAALAAVLPAVQAARLRASAGSAAQTLAGRTTWHVNATATGGGVSEMLTTLLGYALDAGIRARWLVLDGNAEFFAITKRLHNAIHGAGDPHGFGPADHRAYRQVLDRNADDMVRLTSPPDLVMLHDPQTAGLIAPLQRAGVRVAWRSHVGRDVPNLATIAAMGFLRPYIESADFFVFSRRQYAPSWVPASRLWIIPPSIDPLAPKNRYIAPGAATRILAANGLLSPPGAGRSPAVQGAPAPAPDQPVVIQVSRWDRLKDMPGVMAGFARARLPDDVHLLLIGPSVAGVTDDPEGGEVLAECVTAWQALPEPVRRRVSLVSVPMDDLKLNATIINAIQRHAAVVVQKSLAEGFGLTVSEAMWKSRPLLASAVGGIQDQITDRQQGLLVDPYDLDGFARDLERMLGDQHLAHRLGHAARRRVREHFLDDRQLIQTNELFGAMLAARPR